MAKYLDQTGLTYFWGKIKAKISNSVGDINYANENLLDTSGTVKGALDILVQKVNELVDHNHDDVYVPLTRTIAGLDLKTNITAANLTAKLENATASSAGTMTAAQYTKLEALPTNDTLENTYAKKTDVSSGDISAITNSEIDTIVAS